MSERVNREGASLGRILMHAGRALTELGFLIQAQEAGGAPEAPGLEPDQDAGMISDVANDVARWKAANEGALCRKNLRACRAALDWLSTHGRFPRGNTGADQGLGGALGIPGGGSLEAALTLEKLLAIMCKESSFGTRPDATNEGRDVGPFQLSRETVALYNQWNDPDLNHPDDVDGTDPPDIDNSAKVAAWYMAYQLQRLTWREPGRVQDPVEANRMALAGYNWGEGNLRDARRGVKGAGGDCGAWGGVRERAPVSVREYVAKCRAYEAEIKRRCRTELGGGEGE